MIPATWIPHRRSDGELIGWIDIDIAAPLLVAYDRLGRALEPVEDWLEAEEALEEIGLGFLMNRFDYRGHTVRVRHLDDSQVIVTTAMTDAVGDVGEEFTLAFPPGAQLRELR